MGALICENEAYAIRGACYEVYKTLGGGFLEAIYQEALALEFQARGIPFVEQTEIEIYYKGTKLQHTYRPDFVCYGDIIVELKALSALTSEHEAQALNYLKACNSTLALLVNFGHCPGVEIKRIVRGFSSKRGFCELNGDKGPYYNQSVVAKLKADQEILALHGDRNLESAFDERYGNRFCIMLKHVKLILQKTFAQL